MISEKFERYFAKHFVVTDKHKIRMADKNRYVIAGEIYNTYASVYKDLGEDPDVSKQDVVDYCDSVTSKGDEEKRTPPVEFVGQWLKDNSQLWEISSAWKEIRYKEFGVTTYQDLETLRNSIMTDVYNDDLPYRAEEIKSVLMSMSRAGYQNGVATLSKSIAYNERFKESGDQWLDAIYDYFKPTESREIFKALMRHWAWTVKRKINNLPVKYHIWLNFYGAPGLGKTTALKKITAPMDDFVSTTSISKLFDDTREIKRLTENFVLIFDEMAVNVESEASGGRLTADQKAILKSIITGEKMDARIYGTQDQAKRKITFSCISSANEHLYDVIYDDTTMRRFFDFNCTGKRPDSFEHINKYLDKSIYFWKSVDENNDEGYWDPNTELGREITQIQSMYYPTKTTTKMWAEAVNARPGRGRAETAFRAYSQWCRDTGNKAKALQYFVRDIQHCIPQAVTVDGKVFLDFDSEDAEPVFKPVEELVRPIDSAGDFV